MIIFNQSKADTIIHDNYYVHGLDHNVKT